MNTKKLEVTPGVDLDDSIWKYQGYCKAVIDLFSQTYSQGFLDWYRVNGNISVRGPEWKRAVGLAYQFKNQILTSRKTFGDIFDTVDKKTLYRFHRPTDKELFCYIFKTK